VHLRVQTGQHVHPVPHVGQPPFGEQFHLLVEVEVAGVDRR
jgi:hypothetical protein